jgi:hypothetical protein
MRLGKQNLRACPESIKPNFKLFRAVLSLYLLSSFTVNAQSPARQKAERSPAQAPATVPAMPTAEEILSRYLEAVGGRAAWQKLNSRASSGTIDVPAMSLSGTVEIHEKAPNRVLTVVAIGGAAFRQGFDGTVGWTDDPQNGLRDQTGAELAETEREADFYAPLNIRSHYTKFTVSGREKIGDRDAYCVLATVGERGNPDKMYFDAQTGLPIRMVSEHHSPEGVSAFQEDLADYREVDGVKLPFTILQTSTDSAFTIKITEVHHNISLDDHEFAKPAAE